MRTIATGIYKIVYSISGAKTLSFFISILYLTILNMVLLYGLGLLLTGWLSVAPILVKLFSFPYYVVTLAGVSAVSFRMMPAQNILSKEIKTKVSLLPVLVYTAASILILLYIHYFPAGAVIE